MRKVLVEWLWAYALFVWFVPSCLADNQASKINIEIMSALVRDGDIDAACIAQQQNNEPIVEVEPMDLNNDGESEYYVEAVTACGCGARSCPVWIYSRQGQDLRKLASALSHLELAPGFNNGYRNLMNIYTDNEGIFHTPMTYNGAEYVFIVKTRK